MISKLVKEISPFYVMDVLEKAKDLEAQGHDIVHFEVGEPDFKTPDIICSTAIKSIGRGETKYSSSLGLKELRNTIAEDYNNKYSVEVRSDNVIITMGSSPALLLSILTLINPGDEIIITDPYYACYPEIISIAGGVPVKVPIYEDNNYQIKTDELKSNISSKTKAIILNSPANPTGVLQKPEVLRNLSELGLTIISDEIYHGLVYGTRERSILEFKPDSIVVNGFSKLYAMTGWRLGYIIAPDEYVRYIQILQQNLFISANPFVQQAGIYAVKYTKNETQAMIDQFNKRRVAMIKGLKSVGFEVKHNPEGAFYIYVNSSKYGNDSFKLAYDILENAHVAVTPGIDFSDRGENFLRFSYATSMESINEGLLRLDKYLN